MKRSVHRRIWIPAFVGMTLCCFGPFCPGLWRPLTTAVWKTEEGVKVPVPPGEHPRLYLRAEQAKQLPERLKDPVLVPVVERLKNLAVRSKPFAAEWNALQYLATGIGRGAGGDRCGAAGAEGMRAGRSNGRLPGDGANDGHRGDRV